MRRNAVLFVTISLLSGFGSGVMTPVAGIWLLDPPAPPASRRSPGSASTCPCSPVHERRSHPTRRAGRQRCSATYRCGSLSAKRRLRPDLCSP